MIVFPKLLYAHRGSCLKLPENTMQAFEAGIADGANALEMDVHRTRDDVVVVIHDPDGKRVAGVDKKVKDLNFKEISEWSLGSQALKVPTFEQVISRFPNIPLNVDIKDCDPSTIRLVTKLVMDSGESHRVRLTGESRSATKALQKLGYTGPVGMGMMDIALLKFVPKFMIGRRFEGRAAQVPLKYFNFNFATKSFVDKCHSLGVRVDFWVVNDLKTAQRLARLGADGIMSDAPAAVRDWLKEDPKSFS